MPVVPSDFLDAAKELYNRNAVSSSETRARTVLGRAYYAAFLEVREAIRREAGKPGWKVTHDWLPTALKQASDTSVAEIGVYLEGLRELREKADYEISSTVTELQAGLNISSAETVLATAPLRSKRIFDAYKAASPDEFD